MDKKKITIIVVYNLLLCFAALICSPLLAGLVIFSAKRRKTVLHRLALAGLPERFDRPVARVTARPVWVHALSVGEVVSAQGLLTALKKNISPRPLVLSISTKTGFELARERLTDTVDGLFYFPFDLLFAVKRISRRINPALLVIVESDLWPNCLYEMVHRNIPVLLVNARLSERSFAGYRRFSGFSKMMFSFFTRICAQTPGDAARLKTFVANPGRVVTVGNLKFDQKDNHMTQKEIDGLHQMLTLAPGRRVFVAGSTHPGEESIVLGAFKALQKKHPDLCLVIVPRDPGRAGSVSTLFSEAGFSTTRLTTLGREKIKTEPAVWVIDVIGMLARLYALADMAFVGGSLVDFRGHNPLEPAAFSKPILMGPFMSDFKDIAAMLLAAGGAIQVNDAGDIIRAGERILSNPVASELMGRRNFKLFCANKGTVEKTLNNIMTVLAQAATTRGNKP